MKAFSWPALILLAALHLGATASYAQQGYEPPLADESQPDAQQGDGFDMIQRGLGSLLDDFIAKVEPDLNRLGEDMSGALSDMAPVLQDLGTLVDDIQNYQAPERLENGDILIRRRSDAPPPPPIGEHLRDLDRPGDAMPGDPQPRPLRDPDAPEIEL
jgi:hypothetical protein